MFQKIKDYFDSLHKTLGIFFPTSVSSKYPHFKKKNYISLANNFISLYFDDKWNRYDVQSRKKVPGVPLIK